MPKTSEQIRAEGVWGVLVRQDRFGQQPEAWKDKEDAKKYLNAMRKTAARIYTSGLGQALAFLRRKPESIEAKAADDLARLILPATGGQMQGNASPAASLIGAVRGGDMMTLMWATEEALGLLTWFTRYLEGAGVKGEEAEDTELEEAEVNG